MKGFFYSNQTLVSVVAVILFLVILYFIIKALPTKVSKKESKKEESAKIAEEKVEEKKEEVVEEKAQEETEKNKKADKKPKIVQVYKRERVETDDSRETKKAYDPIYDRSVEFVNTSKNIAKFKSFAEEKKEEEQTENVDDFGFVQDVQEDCEFCENKTKHFDHSRRLSKAIKEDNFDNMFDSHITEKYMNINADNHLNLNEDFERKLFDRTEKMICNSKCKCKCNDDVEEQPKFSLFSDNSQIENDDDIEDDDVQINMKTALLSEVYLGKRKKTNQ